MDFELPSLIIAIISFALLYLVLNRYAFGPLFAVMEKRRELIKEQLSTAENSRKAAEEQAEVQRKVLADARKEAHDIIERARVTSVKQADEIVQSAGQEAERLKKQAFKDIESEKNNAMSELRQEVGGISVKIASKIIEKQVDEKSQEQLVNQYLKEVGSK